MWKLEKGKINLCLLHKSFIQYNKHTISAVVILSFIKEWRHWMYHKRGARCLPFFFFFFFDNEDNVLPSILQTFCILMHFIAYVSFLCLATEISWSGRSWMTHLHHHQNLIFQQSSAHLSMLACRRMQMQGQQQSRWVIGRNLWHGTCQY